MRTSTWLLTPLLALSLTACGDDGSTDTDASTSTAASMTTGMSAPTTEPMTSEPTSTTNPTMASDTSTSEPETSTTMPDTSTSEPMTSTDPGTSDTSSTDGTTGMPVELTCDGYCDLYQTGCQDFNEYANKEECLAQCAQWPVGLPEDTAGDSLGCRTYHVTVANMTDPNVHCPHAGPTGAGVCVSADAPQCADYCGTYFKNCTEKLNSYKDMDDCLNQCGEWYPGVDDAVDGDSIGCREYHAGVAQGDPVTHCPHAGPGGAGVCVTK